MNRKYEFDELLNEFNKEDGNIEDTVLKAEKRLKRRKYIFSPAISAATIFVCFVLLANFSAPAAYAFSKIPLIKDLAKAVTFSPSLEKAIENEYYEKLGLMDEKNGVTANLDYYIADKKQMTIFFRLDSEVYKNTLLPDIKIKVDDEYEGGFSYGVNDFGVENGEINSVTIDFVTGEIPESFNIKMMVYEERTSFETMEPIAEENMKNDIYDFSDLPEKEDIDYIAEFEFEINVDAEYIEIGKTVDVNKDFVLDGQKFTIDTVEIYPSNMRINLSADEENTKWLKSLKFYVKTDKGKTIDTIKNGITATGNLNTPMMNCYRAESPYFYDASSLTIYVTGGTFLDKDKEYIYVDLKNKKAENLPENTTVYDTEKTETGWIVEFKTIREEDSNSTYQVFGSNYKDADGNVYDIRSWSTTTHTEGEENAFITGTKLMGYQYDEVWMSANFTSMFEAEKEEKIEVNIN